MKLTGANHLELITPRYLSLLQSRLWIVVEFALSLLSRQGDFSKFNWISAVHWPTDREAQVIQISTISYHVTVCCLSVRGSVVMFNVFICCYVLFYWLSNLITRMYFIAATDCFIDKVGQKHGSNNKRIICAHLFLI